MSPSSVAEDQPQRLIVPRSGGRSHAHVVISDIPEVGARSSVEKSAWTCPVHISVLESASKIQDSGGTYFFVDDDVVRLEIAVHYFLPAWSLESVELINRCA